MREASQQNFQSNSSALIRRRKIKSTLAPLYYIFNSCKRKKSDDCLKLGMMHAIFKLFLSEMFNVSCGLEMA